MERRYVYRWPIFLFSSATTNHVEFQTFRFVVRFENKGGAEYQDFLLDPLDGSVSLNRSLEDNELVQPVILVVKVHFTRLPFISFR